MNEKVWEGLPLARLLLAAMVGLGLGWLAWQLVSSIGWSRDTAWLPKLVEPVLPPLAIAATGNLALNALFLTRNSTRSFGAKWISRSIVFWLVTSCIVLTAFRYYGPISDGFASFLVGSMYLGGAVSFGLLIIPLYLWDIVRPRFVNIS